MIKHNKNKITLKPQQYSNPKQQSGHKSHKQSNSESKKLSVTAEGVQAKLTGLKRWGGHVASLEYKETCYLNQKSLLEQLHITGPTELYQIPQGPNFGRELIPPAWSKD